MISIIYLFIFFSLLLFISYLIQSRGIMSQTGRSIAFQTGSPLFQLGYIYGVDI